MKEFDERQVLIRGKIALQGAILAIVMMLCAAFINDFGIINMEKEIGFSAFMIGASCLLICFLSCSMIIKDAYFGPFSKTKYRRILSVFTTICLLEVALLSFNLLRGKGMSFVSGCSVFMITMITGCLWYRRKDWKS